MDNEQVEMIEDCILRESRMSEWEMSFVSDMNERLLSGKTLTQKQAEKLDEIWEKVIERG